MRKKTALTGSAEARARLQTAEQRLQQLQDAPEAERADATLLRDVARAELTSLTARVNLERARAAVQGAEALAQGARTPEERGADAPSGCGSSAFSGGRPRGEGASASGGRLGGGRRRRRGENGGADGAGPSDKNSGAGPGVPDFDQHADCDGETAGDRDGGFGS